MAKVNNNRTVDEVTGENEGVLPRVGTELQSSSLKNFELNCLKKEVSSLVQTFEAWGQGQDENKVEVLCQAIRDRNLSHFRASLKLLLKEMPNAFPMILQKPTCNLVFMRVFVSEAFLTSIDIPLPKKPSAQLGE